MQKQLSKKMTAEELMEFIYSSGEELKTDSRKVAKAFNKQHAHVLRSIKKLIDSKNNFTKSIFGFCYEESKTQKGKPQPYYEMNKDGFILLVMGFQGEEALSVKIAYIQAFNRRQKIISEENNTLIRRFFNLVEKENQSFAVASMAGRVLQSRKEQKENNMSEMETLKQQIQPDLFDTNKNGALAGVATSQNSVSETTNQR